MGDGEQRISLEKFSIPGRHNRWNAAAAALLLSGVGVAAEDLDSGVLSALEHRMEPVATVDEVLWINDSKATNVAAAVVGITGLDRPVVALIGGQAKADDDLAPLASALQNVRAVVCFGGSGRRFASVFSDFRPHCVPTMSDAVIRAQALAQAGDIVLLSPAGASFDAFDNFEHRGGVFREQVLAMKRSRLHG
jgi:UDP-N-acetylmuramoylalanine--D-glutamate ligase